jgi:hypothetical protein
MLRDDTSYPGFLQKILKVSGFREGLHMRQNRGLGNLAVATRFFSAGDEPGSNHTSPRAACLRFFKRADFEFFVRP